MTMDSQPVESQAADQSAPAPVKSESLPPSPPAQPSASPAQASARSTEIESKVTKPAQPTCSNCKTQTTPLWRRSEDGILCNACALYQKMKGCPRPVTLKTDTIKHRNRSKGTKKEKAMAAGKDGASPRVKSAQPKQSVRSSSTARKSQPGGADADDRDSSYDEDDSYASNQPNQRSMSKRRKRDTPDSDPSPPPSESMYPPHAVLGESALRHYAAQLNARSSSADTRGHHPLPARFALQGRSPSQPPFPYHAALGYRPMYPSYESYQQLQHMAAHQGMQPYGIRPDQLPPQPNWTEAMQQPVRSSSSNTISLPPIRSLTEEIDNDARGRQRERMTLPAMTAPPHAASGALADPGSRHGSQASSRASTVTGIPYALSNAASEGNQHDSSFPQSDSRRPHDTLSESSSGSNSAGSPRSTFQSPYMAPTAASSVQASPGFGPLPDPVASTSNAQVLSDGRTAERRGRSVTRKVDNEIGNRIEALKMHDGVSRSSSPRLPPLHGQENGNDPAYWRSSLSRSRTSSPHPAPADDEVNKLRLRVNELELINSLLVSRLTELEHPRRPSASGTDRSTSVNRSFSSALPPLPPSREDSQGELRATAAMDQS